MSGNRSRSLFAQQRIQQRIESDDDMLYGDALRAVEQCVEQNGVTPVRQFVSNEFIELLRDAAIVLDVDFDTQIAPHFASLADYDRCVYSWRGVTGTWATLMFDGSRHAMLTLLGAPRIDKLVGTFAYGVCSERNVLRIRDVGPYAEMLVQPIAGTDNVLLVVPELRTELVLQNETPHRLSTAVTVGGCE